MKLEIVFAEVILAGRSFTEGYEMILKYSQGKLLGLGKLKGSIYPDDKSNKVKYDDVK